MRLRDGTQTSHPSKWAADVHSHCQEKHSLRNEDEGTMDHEVFDKLNADVKDSDFSGEMGMDMECYGAGSCFGVQGKIHRQRRGLR